MAFATASGGPASMVGFDLARSFTPVQAIGRANGLVNVGGFTASLMVMASIGIVLDLVEPGGMDAYALDDYRLAMAVQYPFWIFGIVQILRYRRRGLDHLRRVHPGAVEEMQAGSAVRAPGHRRQKASDSDQSVTQVTPNPIESATLGGPDRKVRTHASSTASASVAVHGRLDPGARHRHQRHLGGRGRPDQLQ